MFSTKFLKFIEIWQSAFAIERTLMQNSSLDAAGKPIPWYTYPAIEYLQQFDYKGKKVFEFGCGYSSFFWAERAMNVLSIEDKSQWFAHWQKIPRPDNLEIKRLENEKDYTGAILNGQVKYDVIVVDGVFRKTCAENALEALASGGFIIFDDSDRANNSAEYAQALQILKGAGLLQVDFYGFCPMNIYPKTTSVFFSRNFDFPLLQNIQPANGIGNLWAMPRQKRKALYRLNAQKDGN